MVFGGAGVRAVFYLMAVSQPWRPLSQPYG
nr:MAG TPA: hypothetical protein [Caudoviricetes sp.]